MPPRSSEATGDGPLRLNSAARVLGYDRRTLLKHAERLGIYRVGREYRVPADVVRAVQAGDLDITDTQQARPMPRSAAGALSPEETRT
jgi:hypothetical protein